MLGASWLVRSQRNEPDCTLRYDTIIMPWLATSALGHRMEWLATMDIIHDRTTGLTAGAVG